MGMVTLLRLGQPDVPLFTVMAWLNRRNGEKDTVAGCVAAEKLLDAHCSPTETTLFLPL
jgi:hypothetical protein